MSDFYVLPQLKSGRGNLPGASDRLKESRTADRLKACSYELAAVSLTCTHMDFMLICRKKWLVIHEPAHQNLLGQVRGRYRRNC